MSCPRERREEAERFIIGPYGLLSKDSRGRLTPEPEDPMDTFFPFRSETLLISGLQVTSCTVSVYRAAMAVKDFTDFEVKNGDLVIRMPACAVAEIKL